MCDTCGCGDPDVVSVEVQDRILAKNDRIAGHNREHFSEHGVVCVNLMGSPGAGKTALLEGLARTSANGWRLGALAGDLATANDAERLEKAGIPSIPIATGTACHLDAEMVHHALHDFPLEGLDFLFIENVGNLVCPAVYDLGQALNVIALSVTEGEDKPLKYPVMFQKADLVLITKSDLAPHLDVDLEMLQDSISRVMPNPASMVISSKTGDGIDAWISWMKDAKAKTAGRTAATA